MRKEIYYADTALLLCTDNDKTVEGEILTFIPKKVLSIAMNRQVKVTLQYNKQHDIYIGDMGGLEFQSHGPAEVSKW